MTYRFSAARRLKNKKDYELVFKSANKTISDEFVVLHKKSQLDQARLGLAISKKILPTAVQRNRIKRILRESFRQQSLPPIDIVFMAKHGIKNKNNSVLFQKLSVIWDKLDGLYCK